MVHESSEFDVDRGPSKFVMMLAVLDTDMGERTVRFRVVYLGRDFWYDTQIVSAKRQDGKAELWDLRGFVITQDGRKPVSIFYNSTLRAGRMRLEDEASTHGVMETPDIARKSQAFMRIMERMISRYRNRHGGNLDQGILQLFEKAKRVHFAEDHKSLNEAIADLQVQG